MDGINSYFFGGLFSEMGRWILTPNNIVSPVKGAELMNYRVIHKLIRSISLCNWPQNGGGK